jgi:hypothetical protein
MAISTVKPGEDLAQLTARLFDGDPLRFTEVLDLNPDLDVFGDLEQETTLEVPEPSQILRYAQPVFGSVAQALNQVSGITDQVTGAINGVVDALPLELQGYAKEALEFVGEINGVTGQAKTVLEDAQNQLRKYDGQVTKLVPWLLGGKR